MSAAAKVSAMSRAELKSLGDQCTRADQLYLLGFLRTKNSAYRRKLANANREVDAERNVRLRQPNGVRLWGLGLARGIRDGVEGTLAASCHGSRQMRTAMAANLLVSCPTRHRDSLRTAAYFFGKPASAFTSSICLVWRSEWAAMKRSHW